MRMSRPLHALAVATLASALPLAAWADTTLNLDTGATGTSGGDILFNPGVSISPQGAAQLYDYGVSPDSVLNPDTYVNLPGLNYHPITIHGLDLAVNDVFAVQTNGGNYGLAMLTAVSSGSVTLNYLTYNPSGTKIQGGTVTLGGPTPQSIAMVQNNYSFIPPGAPNYGIAPGTLFIVTGNLLAAPGSQAVLQNPANALPVALNGSSVSVTVNGTTVHPAFYYALPTQLGLVLPSNTPVGTGTITVSYGGPTSAPAPIVVVSHAFGFDFYGGALAVATDNADGHPIAITNSAKPGETIVFWGSGLGADTNDDDVNPPTHFDNLSGITALYFGSVQVPIAYQGRSPYQGVDQVAVTVPANSPTGCAVSVVAVSGTGSTAVVSNFVTMPIATAGGVCVDPLAFVSPAQAAALSSQNTVRFGALKVFEIIGVSQPTSTATASFYGIDGASLLGYLSTTQPSLGSCIVTHSSLLPPFVPFPLTGLNAGSIAITGVDGMQPLAQQPSEPGVYVASKLPPGFVPASGGTFTFTGTMGTDVGSFSGSLTVPSQIVWTNPISAPAVSRAQGLTVNWTGGAGAGFVQISGQSGAYIGQSIPTFVCNAPLSARTFTIPPAVLLAMPPGSGELTLGGCTNPASFTPPPGLDFGYTMALPETGTSIVFN